MSSITTRFVVDSKDKIQGDYVNFTVNPLSHQGATGLIFRKIEYPNMNFVLSSSNNVVAVNVKTTSFNEVATLTLDLFDCGTGVNTTDFSILKLIQMLNVKCAEWIQTWTTAGKTNYPAQMYFSLEGEYVHFNIVKAQTNPSTPPTLTYTIAWGGNTLESQLGLTKTTDTAFTYHYWALGNDIQVWTPSSSQKLFLHHMLLCSRAISINLDQRSHVDAFFLMRLPLDHMGSPGEKQIFVPTEETRFFPFRGIMNQPLDFYLRSEDGATLFQMSQEHLRVIIYFDVYYGKLEELQRELH